MVHVPAAAALAAASLLAAAASPALADPGVRVENAAARMVVIPEARGDVRVDVQPGDPRLPVPTVRRDGDRLVVDGGLRGRIASCGVINANPLVLLHAPRAGEPAHGQRVMIRGVGPLTLDHLPLITAHVPLRAQVSVDRAVFGHVGRAERLAFSNDGCGDWTMDDVSGALDVALSGSGDVGAGRAGSLHAALSGSGDLAAGDIAGEAAVSSHGSADATLGRVGGRLQADLAGSGDLHAREAAGAVAVRQSGSGDVLIDGGHASNVSVQSAGSGDFTFGGQAGAVSAASSGSGDIHVAHANGPVSRAKSGSGEVEIGR